MSYRREVGGAGNVRIINYLSLGKGETGLTIINHVRTTGSLMHVLVVGSESVPIVSFPDPPQKVVECLMF